MGTVVYTVIDGEVVSELRSGVERDYVPDPLGSTIALLDNTQTKTDTFEYWPYGESAGRTGTTSTPFQYVGTMGYYNDSSSKNYVRARYLDKNKGRWISEDRSVNLKSEINISIYSDCSPVSYIDVSGNQSNKPAPYKPFKGGNCGINQQSAINGVHLACALTLSHAGRECAIKCLRDNGLSVPDKKIRCLTTWCKNADFECVPSSWCPQPSDGSTLCAQAPHGPALLGKPCTIQICPQSFTPACCRSGNAQADRGWLFLHEMLHCCGKLGDNHRDMGRAAICMMRKCLGYGNVGVGESANELMWPRPRPR